MRCPRCGRQTIVGHVTIRWLQAKGSLLPERGYYCTACGHAFDEMIPQRGDFAFQSVRVDSMSDALRRLQENGDVVVVRHKGGVREVLY
ncbi:MAG TPA: hypothetical protein VEP50_16120 [bacterium]|nr:hypothetical protein [bacterium]